VLFFGNKTGFAPESTLIKGNSTRVALLFRIRRAFSMMLRSIVKGDVPYGTFWWSFRSSRWTPSEFEGWTTGKRTPIVPPLRTWFRRAEPDE